MIIHGLLVWTAIGLMIAALVKLFEGKKEDWQKGRKGEY